MSVDYTPDNTEMINLTLKFVIIFKKKLNLKN